MCVIIVGRRTQGFEAASVKTKGRLQPVRKGLPPLRSEDDSLNAILVRRWCCIIELTERKILDCTLARGGGCNRAFIYEGGELWEG